MKPRCSPSAILAAGLALLQACAGPLASPPPPPLPPPSAAPAAPAPPPAAERYRLESQPVDAETAARLAPLLASAVRTVERFFGAPFPQPFTVVVHPDRASFDASFPPEWGIGKTECWMVASGVASGVQLLSPRAWATQACEHDATDARHVENLLAHELVHVFHGQHNPSPDFVDVTGIDWFAEGLATLASGQLEEPRQMTARQALEEGVGPTELARAWTGRHRYGVCGSLVAYLEHELGRARLGELLAATSGEELLALAGTSEADLLAGWRAFVLAPGGSPASAETPPR